MSIVISQRPNGTRSVGLKCEGVSRTKPEHWKECDINRIMKKARKTGFIGDPLKVNRGQYGDFSSGMDFSEVMRRVTAVKQDFSALPSNIRIALKHDPAEFVDVITNPARVEEAKKLGLLPPADEPSAVPSGVPPTGDQPVVSGEGVLTPGT